MASQHLLFEASGLTLAAPGDLIKAIHESLQVRTVAGTQSWFRGLAVAHGKLLPVTDLGAFAGRRSSTGRTLELSDATGIAALQIDTVYGLSNVPVSDVPLNDSELSGVNGSNLALTDRAIVFENRIHRLLDVAALVQSPAFLNIAETTH
ncbi:chemotaxis protein CheW [Granulosicoccus antarcticus]|uniref:CheW-like domain-containing protein n=1 Tax=Granulosicoccus antarcticus IMCC3135 TaxID=1192854 RepID=A0A2Z2NIZ4_9GAMM|nr:chemotaxis protein CheW [Granulosicoccus antarcticus]ASJ71332.1 hypothetical protein IMCC3135_06100 [Granulosicoccus antarcticus IMCC3135]